MRMVGKLWGFEEVLANTNLYCLKKLHVSPGFQSSLHMHKIKDETFYIEDGSVTMELGDKTFRMRVGESVRIAPGTSHRFANFSMTPCVILEVSTHHSDDDVYRTEESRKI